jgi:6-methylsalicylate decarboxylase
MARLTVDIHDHTVPDFFWRKANEQRGPVGESAPPPWSRESALSFMNDAGIDVALTSVSTPASLAQSSRVASRQLGAFPWLPLPDVDGSFGEVSEAPDFAPSNIRKENDQ